MMFRIAILLALQIALYLFAGVCAHAGEIVEIDGVLHVRNGAEPSGGREVMQLEELWRIGGDEDENFFGLITQVCSDEDGNIYLLDAQLCEVKVFGPDGDYLKTLFRRGEGPGEVTRPVNLALLGDGSVAVAMELPGRLVRVDRSNDPLPNVDIHDPKDDGYTVVDGVFAGGPTLVCSGNRSETPVEGRQGRIHYLALFDMNGKETARLAESHHHRDFNDFVLSERGEMPPFVWATCVDAGGRIYTVSDRDRYAVEVFSPTGRLEHVIERDYTAYQRTDARRQRLYDVFDSLMQGADIDYRIEIESREFAIMPLQHGVRVWRDALWILPSRGVNDQPPGIMMTFDVFDLAGHFVKQVAMQCPGDGEADGLFFVGQDRVLVVTGHVGAIYAQYGRGVNLYDEDDEAAMTVICYRVAGVAVDRF